MGQGERNQGRAEDEVFDQYAPRAPRKGSYGYVPPASAAEASRMSDTTNGEHIGRSARKVTRGQNVTPNSGELGVRGTTSGQEGPGSGSAGKSKASGAASEAKDWLSAATEGHPVGSGQPTGAKQPKTMKDRVNRGKRLAASVAEGVGGDSAKGAIGRAPGGFSSEGAESGGEQAVNDAAKVAGASGAKLAYGDIGGAVLSGATTAVKTRTGKKVIIGAAMAAVTVIALLTLVMSSILGGSNSPGEGAARAQALSPEGISLAAATETVDGVEDLNKIRRVASVYDTPWQVLAAIWYQAGQSNLTGGTGPFNLSEDVINDSGDPGTLTKDEAMALDTAAPLVASAVNSGVREHLSAVGNAQLDAGVTDGTDDEGEWVRKHGESERSVRMQEEAKEGWIEVIRGLPMVGVDSQAETIHSIALAWIMGEQPAVCVDPALGMTGGGIATNVGTTSANLNPQQVRFAQSIINRVSERGMPQRAAVVALVTVAQETMFRMYWNSSVAGSKALADAQGGGPEGGFDLGGGRKSLSVGLYQQQIFADGTWGTVHDGMDPARSTDMFLNALEKIKGWESMPATVAAQRVQRSAHPGAYAKHEPLANQLIKDLPPTDGWTTSDHEHDDVHASAASGEETAAAEGEDSGAGAELTEGPNPHNLRVDSSLRPDVQLVQSAVVKYFGPTVYAMGGYRAGSVGHSQRIATDLMITDYKTGGKANGDKLAEFLIANRVALGVDYLIWWDQIWMGPTKGWQPYSKGGYGKHLEATRGWNDTTLHYDHIHVETFGSTGTGGALVGGNGGMSVGGNQGVGDGCSPGGMAGTSPLDSGVGVAAAPFMGKDDYPHRMPGDVSWKAGSKDPGPDPWGMYKRECVSFVAWRLNQLMGWQSGQPYPFTKQTMRFPGSANATNWGPVLGARGYKVDQTPAVGAVAWWAGGRSGYVAAGHVAIVLAVNDDGTVLIEQYNGGSIATSPTKASYSQQTIKVDNPSGYIHVADVQSAAPAAD